MTPEALFQQPARAGGAAAHHGSLLVVPSRAEAEKQVERIAREVLTNRVIEQYQPEIVE